MDELSKLAERWTDLPRSYEEIFKRSLDRRGRPVKSLTPASDGEGAGHD